MSDAEVTLRPVAQTVIDGKVVHRSSLPFKQERKAVMVQNAPVSKQRDVADGEDISDFFEGEYDEINPHYNDLQVAAFAYDGVVPLTAIRYWLRWGNQMTMSSGESAMDYPTAEGLRGFLGVILGNYTPKGEEKTVLTPHPIKTVSYQDFVDFMESAASLEREPLMLALDEFVGQYV